MVYEANDKFNSLSRQTDLNKLNQFIDKLEPKITKNGRSYNIPNSSEQFSFKELSHHLNELANKQGSTLKPKINGKNIEKIKAKLLKLEGRNKKEKNNRSSKSLLEIYQLATGNKIQKSKNKPLSNLVQSCNSHQFQQKLLKKSLEDHEIKSTLAEGGLELLPLEVRLSLLENWIENANTPHDLIDELIYSIPLEAIESKPLLFSKIDRSIDKAPSLIFVSNYKDIYDISCQKNKSYTDILYDTLAYCCSSAESDYDIETYLSILNTMDTKSKVDLIEMSIVRTCSLIESKSKTLNLKNFHSELESLLTKHLPLGGSDFSTDIALTLAQSLLKTIPESKLLELNNDPDWKQTIQFIHKNIKDLSLNKLQPLPIGYPKIDISLQNLSKKTYISSKTDIGSSKHLSSDNLNNINATFEDMQAILEQIPHKKASKAHKELIAFACTSSKDSDSIENVLTCLNQLSSEDKLSLFSNQFIEVMDFAEIDKQTDSMRPIQTALNTIYKHSFITDDTSLDAGTYLSLFRALLDTLPNEQQKAIYTDPLLSQAADYLTRIFPEPPYEIPQKDNAKLKLLQLNPIQETKYSNEKPLITTNEVSTQPSTTTKNSNIELDHLYNDMQAILEQIPHKKASKVHKELIAFACTSSNDSDSIENVLTCLNQLSSEDKLSLFSNQFIEVMDFAEIDKQTDSMRPIQTALNTIYKHSFITDDTSLDAGTYLSLFRALLDTLPNEQQKAIYTDPLLSQAADYLTRIFPEPPYSGF